ncbi:MAG TPA: YihY/virulence factor BrkB family protein [Longimicrobiales bacterium]|nr:YihY/virulence factor BrkB family protein [Longimicrobiales bacterium]
MAEPARGAAAAGDPDAAGVAAVGAVADPADIPRPLPGTRPEDRSLHRRFWSYLGAVAGGVWKKGEDDNIFFLAGAISFNVLVAFIPLLLAIIGIAGTVLKGQRAQDMLVQYLRQTIPGAVDLPYEQLLSNLAANSTGLLSIGTLFFLWVATRLVGTLRTVLREIFDIAEGRSIVAGKIFDIKMVFAAGTLFALNVGLTIGLRLGAEFVTRTTGIHADDVPFLSQASNLWPQMLAFATIWVMFLLIYRYLPPRRIRWSTAVIAATFTSMIGEALKLGFTFYVESIADFNAFWGNVATFVILVLWIYYTSVVFILGGEVAQVVTMNRIRKRQKERLW